jgi:hypothetical protein
MIRTLRIALPIAFVAFALFVAASYQRKVEVPCTEMGPVRLCPTHVTLTSGLLGSAKLIRYDLAVEAPGNLEIDPDFVPPRNDPANPSIYLRFRRTDGPPPVAGRPAPAAMTVAVNTPVANLFREMRGDKTAVMPSRITVNRD